METQSLRLRLVFEDRSVLSETQRSYGMNQSWLLIEPQQHPKISDVCNHLLHIFNLRRSCPNGILLYMEDFVLPPSESTRILKDKEIICVKRKEMALAEAIKGANAGNLLDYPEVNRKEPVNNGMLLLANEEFDKETGGYQSESEDAEDEKLEDDPSPIQTPSKKRKASKTSRSSSKKKKHRSMMDGVEDEVVTEDNNINNHKFCPMKIIKPSKEKSSVETILVEVKSSPKLKRKKKHRVASGDEGEVRDEICNIDDDKIITKKKIKPNEELKKEDDEISDEKVKSSRRTKRSEEHLEDNVQGIEQASTTPDGDKKGPSRSARRKKAKRQWKRELTKISQKLQPDTDTHLEGTNDHPKGHEKNLIEEEKRKCNGNTDTQLVACVVKPGHIRFEPLDEDEDGKEIEVADVAFEWNGISSKKKGQKWGLEKYSASRKIESQTSSKEESSPMLNVDTVVDLNDFENLPLCTSPKEGDVIAYRLVELSSSWTPELSSYRVGKVSHFDSNNIVLNPVPEYPILFDKMDEEGPDNYSLYKEDGSLEIDFTGLVDVKVVNGVGQSQSVTQGDGVNLISKDPSPVCEVRRKKEGNNDKTWSEVMEALNKKKSELVMEANEETKKKKDSEWNRWSYRALRGSALGPTMALLRSNNNI
ncbi:unnamed protein product [Lactuca saligna]|uniref:Coilin n=1 Tax=Lactuca saligna TaxID=75948 RepID=A0AA36ELD1_LACSI|nr:unnamed protein product [Lactuca saligna]